VSVSGGPARSGCSRSTAAGYGASSQSRYSALAGRRGPKMLLVSVGTGSLMTATDAVKASQMTLLYNARHIPSALLNAASVEQDLLCAWSALPFRRGDRPRDRAVDRRRFGRGRFGSEEVHVRPLHAGADADRAGRARLADINALRRAAAAFSRPRRGTTAGRKSIRPATLGDLAPLRNARP